MCVCVCFMMAELVIAMVEVRADLCLRVIHSFLHVSVMHKTLLFCQGLFLSQE